MYCVLYRYVLAYDLFGHYRDRRFSMGQEALTQRVVDAKFFRAVTGASRVFHLSYI